jgi:hypothetical protein
LGKNHRHDASAMKMKRDLLKNLKVERGKILEAIVEKALMGQPISEDVGRLESHDKLIAACTDTPRKHWLPALLVGAACTIAGSLSLVIRIPTVSVHASIETDSVTFELAEDWQSRDTWRLGRAPVRLDGFTEIRLPPEFAPESKLQEQAWFDIDKAKVTMSDVRFNAGGRVSLLRTPPATHLLSVGAPFRGQIHALDTSVMQGGGGIASHLEISKSLQFAVPATFQFYSEGAGVVPAQIRLSLSERIILRDIPIRSLSFSREEAGAAVPPVYVSGITSGTVTIGETGEKVTLDPSTQLQLGSLVGQIRELEIGPKVFRLSIEGKAKAALTGTAGFEQNLVPSWLSYLFHQERLSFFWGSIAFLWSVLWSARQLLFK